MSNKKKLKRNFSGMEDYSVKPGSEDELDDLSLQRSTKKKRICLDSESESESDFRVESIQKNDGFGDTSDDDEPISNIAKKITPKLKEKPKEIQHYSSDSSEEEPLAKFKKTSKNSNGQNGAKILDSESENELNPTSDKEDTLGQNATATEKKSDKSFEIESEDESLVMKNKKDKDQAVTNGNNTSSDEEPISKIVKGSKHVKKFQKDSEKESLAVKNKNLKQNQTHKKDKNQSIPNGDVSSDDEKKSLTSISKTFKKDKKSKTKCLESDSSDSDGEYLPVKNTAYKQKLHSRKAKSQAVTDSDVSSDDDEKPLSSISKEDKKNETECSENDSSDSEEESLTVNKTSKKKSIGSKAKSQAAANGDVSSDDEEMPLSSISKEDKKNKTRCSENDSSNSEEESLTVKNKTSKKKSIGSKAKSKAVANGDVSSDDEERPLSNVSKEDKKKKTGCSENDSNDSEEDFLTAKNKTSKKKSIGSKAKSQAVANGGVSSNDEEKPLSSLSKGDKKRKIECFENYWSDSEDESLTVKNKTSKKKSIGSKVKSQAVANGNASSDDEEMPLSSISKEDKENKSECSENGSSDSDKESLTAKNKTSKKKSSGSKAKNQTVANGKVSSDDEEKPLSSISKEGKKNKNKNSSNGKIDHLKKYLRVAGIHVKSYDKLFEDCKSIKSKTEKLLGLLHDKGLKGRPTIEKCKKLKKKIETKKEIAELDTSNIIKSEGRSKRGAAGKRIENVKNTENSPVAKKYLRLQDVFDNEESD